MNPSSFQPVPQPQAIQMPAFKVGGYTILLMSVVYWNDSGYNPTEPDRRFEIGLISGETLTFEHEDADAAYRAYLSIFGQARL